MNPFDAALGYVAMVWPVLPCAPGGTTLDGLVAFVERQEHGNRNAGLHWAACCAAEAGLLDCNGVEALVEAAVRSGLRGGEIEARWTVASAMRHAHGPVAGG